MIRVNCHGCGVELDKPGALLFSPPTGRWTTLKMHLCIACYERVERFLVDPNVHGLKSHGGE